MKKAGNWYRKNLDEIGALCVLPEQTPRESTRNFFMDETPVERVGFIEVVAQVVEKEGLEGVRFIGLIGVCRGNRRIRVAKYRLFQTQVENPSHSASQFPRETTFLNRGEGGERGEGGGEDDFEVGGKEKTMCVGRQTERRLHGRGGQPLPRGSLAPAGNSCGTGRPGSSRIPPLAAWRRFPRFCDLLQMLVTSSSFCQIVAMHPIISSRSEGCCSAIFVMSWLRRSRFSVPKMAHRSMHVSGLRICFLNRTSTAEDPSPPNGGIVFAKSA